MISFNFTINYFSGEPKKEIERTKMTDPVFETDTYQNLIKNIFNFVTTFLKILLIFILSQPVCMYSKVK